MWMDTADTIDDIFFRRIFTDDSWHMRLDKVLEQGRSVCPAPTGDDFTNTIHQRYKCPAKDKYTKIF